MQDDKTFMGVLGQLVPSLQILEWIFLPFTQTKVISTTEERLCQILIKGCFCSQQLTTWDPDIIHLPITKRDWENLLIISVHIQIAMMNYLGNIEHHLPHDKLLRIICNLPLSLRACV